eukprot:TRINITY_DN3925_c0_g1_i2.p1 TRINITY_DN3925_c0_g1~~TRINITY_DN3925_c0_g1_i2.p1  ORF type:complete len:1242 (+),score=341.90 TRINITY_DN3925_c0_g1_i2:777-4502(+)
MQAMSAQAPEAKSEEQQKLAVARKKEKEVQKFEEQKRQLELQFKERKAHVEKLQAEAKKQTEDPKENPSDRVVALVRAQKLAAELEELIEEERTQLQKLEASAVTLTMEESRLLRGVKAMEGLRKQLQTSNKFAKVVTALEQQKKTPSAAEVKAKKKMIDDTLRAIEDEQRDLTTKKASLTAELTNVKAQANSTSTPMVEKLIHLEKAATIAQQLEDVTQLLAERQEDWKKKKESLKFTPDEERVLRGIQALNKARAARVVADKKSVEEKALENLRRLKTKGIVQKQNDLRSEKQRLEEKVSDLEEQLLVLDEQLKKENDASSSRVVDLVAQRHSAQTALDALQDQIKDLDSQLSHASKEEEKFGPSVRKKSVAFPQNFDVGRRSSSVGAGLDPHLALEVRDATKKIHAKIKEAQVQGGDTEMRALFDKYDLDGGGCLGLDEWIACLKDLGISQNEDLLEALFQRYDADGSGSIEYNEFIADLPAEDEATQQKELEKIQRNLKEVLRQKRGMQMLRSLFSKYDADGNGTLDVEEFAATLQDLGVGKGANFADLKALFEKFDSDGSGSLEFMEFVQAMTLSSLDERKSDAQRLKRAKEKQQQIQKQQEEKTKEETYIKERKALLTKELDQLRAKSDDARPAEKLVLLTKMLPMQEELESVLKLESDFEPKWAAQEVKLDEDELRLLRGIKAMQGVKKQLEATKSFHRVLSEKEKTGPTRTPTAAEVKAKIVAFEKASIEFDLRDATLKERKRHIQQTMDELQDRSQNDPNLTMEERLNMLTKAAQLAQTMQDVAEEIDQVQEEWKLKSAELKLDKDEERVLRGIQAMKANKSKVTAPPEGAVRRAKTKMHMRTTYLKDLHDEQARLHDLVSKNTLRLKRVTAMVAHRMGAPSNPDEIVDEELELELQELDMESLLTEKENLAQKLETEEAELMNTTIKLTAVETTTALSEEEEKALKAINAMKDAKPVDVNSLLSRRSTVKRLPGKRMVRVGSELSSTSNGVSLRNARKGKSFVDALRRVGSMATSVGPGENADEEWDLEETQVEALEVVEGEDPFHLTGMTPEDDTVSQWTMKNATPEPLSLPNREGLTPNAFELGHRLSKNTVDHGSLPRLSALEPKPPKRPKEKYEYVTSVVSCTRHLPKLGVKDTILSSQEKRIGKRLVKLKSKGEGGGEGEGDAEVAGEEQPKQKTVTPRHVPVPPRTKAQQPAPRALPSIPPRPHLAKFLDSSANFMSAFGFDTAA